ncbi:NUDIX domain-containing protein, partial [Francisella tularensis subsp. holarctica]|uniref:NUDIX domain-containing protein n=1 Tax=Francisella tularensis TaxID=263 RepID=UPI002381A1E2
GYRENVAIVLLTKQNRVFWGQRRNRTYWQFPQGGVATGETPLHAMYRELQEEIGLRPQDVEVIASTRDWYKYDIQDSLFRTKEPICLGQKQ